MRVSEIARWRLAPYRPTDSLPSVVGSPDKARQRRLRGSARNFVSADKPVKHTIGIFLNIFITYLCEEHHRLRARWARWIFRILNPGRVATEL
ncbi:hypothetical protein SCA50_2619 [Salmonella enterica subsp. enterica serovar Choleraesuis str. SCSA50]|uniref:Uncharacterized protein n=2 Tax=Salmonella enterica subsp. enterica serovar Choleraesuis TaxID=119912 RepID=Q57LQ4_SALCH|nr:hypothetical protein SCH_2452 [Salmonella enterica subsp. enterica serovar Choleraesuis str. SC-B67]EFZ07076.1 hypothetical protein SCA50_2619 [Salmonella enterica subsp. enterica serovar Choleraesuis str. SCSA50]